MEVGWLSLVLIASIWVWFAMVRRTGELSHVSAIENNNTGVGKAHSQYVSHMDSALIKSIHHPAEVYRCPLYLRRSQGNLLLLCRSICSLGKDLIWFDSNLMWLNLLIRHLAWLNVHMLSLLFNWKHRVYFDHRSPYVHAVKSAKSDQALGKRFRRTFRSLSNGWLHTIFDTFLRFFFFSRAR